MKPKDVLKALEQKWRRRDVSPAQVRAALAVLGWDPWDLADAVGRSAEGTELASFLMGDHAANFVLPERYRIAEALRLAGVTLYRTKAGEEGLRYRPHVAATSLPEGWSVAEAARPRGSDGK